MTQPNALECEAESRNLQALHAMEVDWGAGIFDYGKIRQILTGPPQRQREPQGSDNQTRSTPNEGQTHKCHGPEWETPQQTTPLRSPSLSTSSQTNES